MEQKRQAFSSVDEYIVSFPLDIQEILKKIRTIIKDTVPDATEHFAYGIPTYTTTAHLVHFAAFKKHLGFYPTPTGIEAFKTDLAEYTNAKGSVQFPFDKEIPYDLIRRMVLYRVEEESRRKPRKSS